MTKIGVVIPVYNGEKTIEKSIESLFFQTYKDWLAVIINDGSTDRTRDILDKYSMDSRFHVFHWKENKGRPHARQKGLELVRELGLKYMCMLDADDWYYPNKLKSQFEILEKNKDLTLVSSAVGVTNIDGDFFKILRPFPNFKSFYCSDFREFIKLPHASSIIRVAHIGKYLKYDEDLKLAQDQDFLRRLLINRHYAFDPCVQYIYNREESFSVVKYRRSMFYDFLSYKNLQFGIRANTFYLLQSTFKFLAVWLLSIFNLQRIYLARLGVNPASNEILEYKVNNKYYN